MIEQINTTLILKSSGLIETNYIGTDQSISSKYLLGNEMVRKRNMLTV